MSGSAPSPLLPMSDAPPCPASGLPLRSARLLNQRRAP